MVKEHNGVTSKRKGIYNDCGLLLKAFGVCLPSLFLRVYELKKGPGQDARPYSLISSLGLSLQVGACTTRIQPTWNLVQEGRVIERMEKNPQQIVHEWGMLACCVAQNKEGGPLGAWRGHRSGIMSSAGLILCWHALAEKSDVRHNTII